MDDALAGFHSLVRRWFAARFQAPSPIQRLGWPAIGAGHDTLLCAATGTGKTLAAFLWAIDRLVREAESGALKDAVSVLYVSPLKALANDVRINLDEPLRGICEIARAEGRSLPEIRAMVRTGDTLACERQAMVKRPPHILVTTPESLFILLTSKRFRQKLAQVQFVIVDELHALAGNKRGAHLAVTLERLEALVRETVGVRPTRIGLSATLNPIEVLGEFLCGAEMGPGGARIVRPFRCVQAQSGARALDLQVVAPGPEVGPLATHKHWEATYDELAKLIKEHRTTLVFTLSRRSAERIALNLQKRLGPDAVMAHHGSLARQERLKAEQKLKRGELKVIVATSSLELGIDVGSVELVCQIDSPKSISAAIQRIGRSGHVLGGVPKGRFFALTAEDLLECAAVVRAIKHGRLDEVEIPRGCLDVAAQQIVAIAAERGEVSEGEILKILGGAYNFRELDLAGLRRLLFAMAQETPNAVRGSQPLIFYDAVNGRVRSRRSARMVAITCAGTIPDPGNYDVVIESEGRKIGEVEEDFAQESSRGDVFALGSMAWQIQRLSRGRLLVEAAPGMAPTLPFWHSEALGRSLALSAELCELRKEILARSSDESGAIRWLCQECAMEESAARQALNYVRANRAVLGELPDFRTLVIERFFDGLGSTQLVIHSPFGMRFNRGLGLALRKRLCRSFNFEIQASATDDGVLLSLNQRHSFPPDELIAMLPADSVRDTFCQAVLDAPMFETRFRHVAARALSLRRNSGGKPVPVWVQRLRAQDLLVALFPQQQACFENRPLNVPLPDHFLVTETLRECMEEAADIPKLEAFLKALEAGEVKVKFVDTLTPSLIAHRLLLAWDYAFLDDGERANRRSRTVATNRALIEQTLQRGNLAGLLDREVVERVELEASGRDKRYKARDADELYELLRRHGMLSREALAERAGELAQVHIEALERERRITAIDLGGGLGEKIVAVEDLPLIRVVYPNARLEGGNGPAEGSPSDDVEMRQAPEPSAEQATARSVGRDDAVAELVRRVLRTSRPLEEREVADRLGIELSEARNALLALEAAGHVFRGRYTSASAEQWCERTNLERIHRLSLERLRKTFEPCGEADFVDFLLRWHHVGGQGLEPGIEGVATVLEQLAGLAFVPEFWEEAILRARIVDYRSEYLDLLCAGGRFGWFGVADGSAAADKPTKVAILPRTPTSPWVARFVAREPAESDLPVYRALIEGGAQFLDQLCARVGWSEQEVIASLLRLAAAGLVANDSFAPLRMPAVVIKAGGGRKNRRGMRKKLAALQARLRLCMTGRWSALARANTTQNTLARDGRELALSLLFRHGILAREMLALENIDIKWAELGAELRRLEFAGVIRAGYFVQGLSGEQYALPEALEVLRACRHRGSQSAKVLALSAADPANPYGISLPSLGVAREPANIVAFAGGRPVLALAGSALKTLSPTDEGLFEQAVTAIVALRRKVRIVTIDGEPALSSSRLATLAAMSFYSDGTALVYNGLPGPPPRGIAFGRPI